MSTNPGDRTRPAGKTRRLVVVGDSAFAEVAHEYFETESPYAVAAFAVERPFLRRASLLDRPVVALDEIAARFPPADHDVYVAVVYTQLNRLRTRLADEAERLGYRLASFVSPRATIARSATLGPHCFVFEGNVIQPFATLGRNVVLWSGNHIGHHTTIGDNAFLASHVVVSGGCTIGDNCFLGVNATIANDIEVAEDCWIGPGALVAADTVPGAIYRGQAARPSKVSARHFFKV